MSDLGHPLPGDLVEFFESGVSILVATRDTTLRPACARAIGASVRANDRVVTIYLPEAASRRTLANLHVLVFRDAEIEQQNAGDDGRPAQQEGRHDTPQIGA